MPNIRKPIQARSLEKYNLIIEKGFELICEKGYYNTNTKEIAHYAGVSTGIIYQYFNDKRDIFLKGVENYSSSIMFPMIDDFYNVKFDKDNFDDLIDKVINTFIRTHKISKKAHEELMAMSHTDIDVADIFRKYEFQLTNKIVGILNDNDIKIDYIYEKVHIIIGMVENLCHEIVYHHNSKFNYENMKKEVIDIIKYLLIKEV